METTTNKSKNVNGNVDTKQVSDVNRQIIGETYEKTRHEIFTIFRQACIPVDVCEDLVQEVFLKILGLDLILADHLKGMAVKIAYQKRIDYLRHRACRNKVQNDLSWQMDRFSTNTEVEVNDILNAEMRVIQTMMDTDRKIYHLTRIEEKTADEIVLETGLSKRAVESRIYRTRMMVREQLRKVVGY